MQDALYDITYQGKLHIPEINWVSYVVISVHKYIYIYNV